MAEITKIFYSETTSPNDLLIGTNNVYKVLYKWSSFCLDPAMGTSCFWLAETVIKIFSPENTTSPTDLLHSTNDYVKSSTRIPHFFFVFWKNAGNLQFLFLLWRIFKENLGTNADFSFLFDVALIMAAMCNSFFLLTETFKFASSDTTSLNDLELVTNDVCM